MAKYTFGDYAASLQAGLVTTMKEDLNDGNITQTDIDMACFFEFEAMEIDASTLFDLMETAFNAGQKSTEFCS